MILHRRFYILDEIFVYREKVHFLLRVLILNHSEGYITAFPVTDLELLTNAGTTTCINLAGEIGSVRSTRSVTRYITPCTQFTSVIERHMASGL